MHCLGGECGVAKAFRRVFRAERFEGGGETAQDAKAISGRRASHRKAHYGALAPALTGLRVTARRNIAHISVLLSFIRVRTSESSSMERVMMASPAVAP